MHGVHAVGQVLALGKAVSIAGQIVPLRILCRLIAAGRFQIDGKNRAFFGRFNLCVAVVGVLDDAILPFCTCSVTATAGAAVSSTV